MPEKAGIPALPIVIFPLHSLFSILTQKFPCSQESVAPALPCYGGRMSLVGCGELRARGLQRFGGAGIPGPPMERRSGAISGLCKARDLSEHRHRYPEKAGLRCTPISVTVGRNWDPLGEREEMRSGLGGLLSGGDRGGL